MKRLALAVVCLLLLASSARAALLVHTTAAGSLVAGNVTTSALNTTGASLCAVATAGFNAVLTVTDSASNTWQNGNAVSLSNRNMRISYVVSPTTSASHTFTVANADNRIQGVVVACFSRVLAFDTQNTGATQVTPTTTIQPGSLTPGFANNLLLSMVGGDNQVSTSADSGSVADTLISVSGTNFGVALIYYEQSAATSQNPTFTVGANGQALGSVSMAFQMSAGGAPCSNLRLLGVGCEVVH